MIYDGALAANGVLAAGRWVWCLGDRRADRAMDFDRHQKPGQGQHRSHGGLFLMTLVLCFIIFKKGRRGAPPAGGGACPSARGGAFRRHAPSWLPLISDYTREAEKPLRTQLSALLCMACQLLDVSDRHGRGHPHRRKRHRPDPAKAGLGVTGLLIVVLSTRDHHLPGRIFRRRFPANPSLPRSAANGWRGGGGARLPSAPSSSP